MWRLIAGPRFCRMLSAALLVQGAAMGACAELAATEPPGRGSVGARSAVRRPGQAARAVLVDAQARWTDTGVELARGALFGLEAEGSLSAARRRGWGEGLSGARLTQALGPRGTYLWPASFLRASASAPLPAMADGPYPAFALVGKIGSGEPFYVGERYAARAAEAGRLWLGINAPEDSGVRGAFRVTVELPAAHPPEAVAPPAEPPIIEPGSRRGAPIPGARVLLLYVDGLRPDVLRQMADAGFLPHLRRTFLDGGVAVPQAFTVFPSNTLISNGALCTGLFSDRTGIKSQNQFERSTLKPRGQLSRWLPDGFIPQPATRVINLLDKYAPESTHAFLVKRGVPTLASRLGHAYGFTTLPIAPLNPPQQWLHRAVNTLGPLDISNRISARLDEVNAQYALEELIGTPDLRVLAVWLPLVDKTCHHSPHGQFGAARRDLARVDELWGRLLARLTQVGWDRSTYAILLSDHGHLGGELPMILPRALDASEAGRQAEGADASWVGRVNRACNLPRDWAYRQLGCNARVVGQEWGSPGIRPDRFIFFDNQGAGQAKLFLPYGSYGYGAWRRNRLFELTHYQIRPTDPPLDLLESLRGFQPPGWDGQGPAPVDLLFVKLDEQRVLVSRSPESQALIHRLEDAAGAVQYRYEPVRRVAQSSDGALRHEPARPGEDPLGYLRDPGVMASVPGAAWFDAPHTADEWLRATHQSRYPDLVVGAATFFAWREPVADLAEARDPDLLLTASPGWSFRSDGEEGTDHGYPLAGSTRITLFIAGPNVAPGRLAQPQRIVDLLPTVLEMAGWPYDPSALDGRAIQGIYE